ISVGVLIPFSFRINQNMMLGSFCHVGTNQFFNTEQYELRVWGSNIAIIVLATVARGSIDAGKGVGVRWRSAGKCGPNAGCADAGILPGYPNPVFRFRAASNRWLYE